MVGKILWTPHMDGVHQGNTPLFRSNLLQRPVGSLDASQMDTTTVTTYQEEFEKLSHWVDGLPQNFLIGCFVVGLRDKVRLDVIVKQP